MKPNFWKGKLKVSRLNDFSLFTSHWIAGIDLDDLMDEGVSDADGRFELRGSETEITDIDPKLNVYHDCNDETTVSAPRSNKVKIFLEVDGVETCHAEDYPFLNLPLFPSYIGAGDFVFQPLERFEFSKLYVQFVSMLGIPLIHFSRV